MSYTVNKSDNKAWLKEDAVMFQPPLYPDGSFQNKSDGKKYNKHIASLRTIPIAPEYVDYWSEGAKVEEGEFEYNDSKCAIPCYQKGSISTAELIKVKTVLRLVFDKRNEYNFDEFDLLYKDYILPDTPDKIPVQKDDEAALWDEIVAKIATANILSIAPSDVTGIKDWKKEVIEKLKSKYQIKRKQ